MKERIKLSIIVPIYNTGHMLRNCADSILAQTLHDFELILIDDGSKDESAAICDEYAKKDKRVKVVHKQNEGVSIARNTGIAMAKGEYIGFIDSDDWIDEDMYERLCSVADKCASDIVMCDAVTVYGDGREESDTITGLAASKSLDKSDFTPKLLMEMAGAAWRCLYRRELLTEHNIIFPIELKFSEDRIFNILAMGFAERTNYIKKPYYKRFMREGSAVNKHYENMIDIVIDARARIRQALDTAWGGDKEYKDMYENQAVGLAYTAINNAFYKDSKLSLRGKYKAVKDICNQAEIRSAIQTTGRNDLRARLIMGRHAIILCAIAVVLNKKYGR